MGKNIAVIGGQWGDEGKGKIVDYVVFDASTFAFDEEILNYRWQGGKNAGHIVVRNGVKYALHQIPSGIVASNVYALLGKGMFVHPRALLKEIRDLMSMGLIVDNRNLGVSSQAHMTLDYHTAEDAANFNLAEHSSTGSGIKQTARDKANRIGIRFAEFLDAKLMQGILEDLVYEDLKTRHPDLEKGFAKKLAESYEQEREALASLLVQENDLFSSSRFAYKIGEGAQGVGLDLDSGLYPGITSSNPSQPAHRPDTILGVFKAYASSVGMKDRPFIGEMTPSLQKMLATAWDEFGTTTGKQRHIGWFDAVFAKYAMQTAHMDEISLTCLDKLGMLGKIGEPLQVVVGYKIGGKVYDKWDVSFDRRDTLWKAEPVFKEFKSWSRTIDDNGELREEPRIYRDYLQETLGKEFALLGTGRETEQIIVQKNLLQ